MTDKNAANASKGKDADARHVQPEVLSPRLATVRLLLVEESVGELKSGMAVLNLTVNRIVQKLELVVAAFLQVANPWRMDEPRRRPAQVAAGQRPTTNSLSDLMSQEGKQRGFKFQETKNMTKKYKIQGNLRLKWPWGRRNFRQIQRHDYGDRTQDYKMKIDLPSFNGKLDLEAFLDWNKNVESFF